MNTCVTRTSYLPLTFSIGCGITLKAEVYNT
jgi:hypothetical protein